jgi:putrescine aminotransferase
MVVSPPLIITEDDVDVLVTRARKALDETYQIVKDEGLLKAAS